MIHRLQGCCALVTGGCGFIGRHLVNRLLELGVARVLVIDDLSTGMASALPPEATLLESDFSKPDETLREALGQADLLFHLAAVKHHQTLDAPDRALEVNVLGTHRLLELAARSSLQRVVFASSLYAYGRRQLPLMQESEQLLPDTVYGCSKVAGEHLLRCFHRTSGTPYTTLRYFFTYGPGQETGLGYPSVVYANFARILRGEAPVIFGDGKQALDYCYVGDLVQATVLASCQDTEPQTYNVGSGTGLSITDLTELMLKVAKSSQRPVFAAADATAGSFRAADTTRIQSALDWKSSTSLEEGLTHTYAWMKRKLKA